MKMPEEFRCSTATIGTILSGESGWTVPWALIIDNDWNCYLRGGFELDSSGPHGTVTMFVSRDGDTYNARVVAPDEGWRRSDMISGDLIPTNVEVVDRRSANI